MPSPLPGVKKAFDSIRNAPRDTRRAIRRAYFTVGQDHIDELSRQMLADDKQGRVYIRRTASGRRRRQRASAPGQTAANRTGRMRKGRGYQLRGSDQMEFGIRGVPYSAFLERGTRTIAPRPSLGNTVRALQKNTDDHFERSLKRELI